MENNPDSQKEHPSDGWIQRRVLIVKRTGNLQVCNEPSIDLKAFSLPEYTKIIPIIKLLDLSRTNITTLDGIPKPFSKLTTFVADKSQITDFRNFKVLANARSFSLKQTPVSKHPHYMLSLLLCVGTEKISTIDGQIIKGKLKSMVNKYPQPITSELINKGWMAEYPVPTGKRYHELSEEYKVDPSSSGNVVSPKQVSITNLPEIIDDDEEEDIDEIDGEVLISRLHEKHEEMLMKGQAMFGLISEDRNAYLSGQISSIFKAHGLQIDSNSDQNIIEAVNLLCHNVAMNRTADDIVSND